MKKILTFIAVLLILTSCSMNNSSQYQRYFDTSINSGFDTQMELLAFTESEKEFKHYFEMMKETFWSYHILFDKYNNYENVNNIKTINDQAGIAPVKVDSIIIDLLLESKKYSEISDYFDITYGAVYRVWHDYREEGQDLNSEGKPGRVPSQKELEDKVNLTGWDKVEIDSQNNTVYLKLKGMELDVGAIAKGYATEMVALKLEKEGLKHAIVSGGGNIRTINTKPDDVPWVIGISEPNLSLDAPTVDSFEFKESMSVVTSGDYQRAYYGPNEVMYSHLINPKTLVPETYFRSVSIITKNSTMADALSTSLFMMTFDEAQEFISTFNAKYPDDKIEVVWIEDENPDWYQGTYDYMITDGLKDISKNLNKK